MKIRRVVANNHKHEFEIHTSSTRTPVLTFPYCKLEKSVCPTPDNPLLEVYPDPELANEGFTWHLESGDEGSLHIDAALEENLEPAYMAQLELYRLTTEALKAFKTSGLSKAQMAKKLRTSPAQLQRLLDPKNAQKSVGQVLALLRILGKKIAVTS
jgi:hypothetical protein